MTLLAARHARRPRTRRKEERRFLTGPKADAHAAHLMSLDPLLLNLLACPIDKQALLYLAEYDILYNPRLRRSYNVRDGIPVMLAAQGDAVTDEEHRALLLAAASGGAVATLQVPVSGLLSDDNSGEETT